MISVIIPMYNREKTIIDAIKSVLNQSYSDFEVIVVDDGSTDNSANIVKNINDNRVKYYYQENAGACAARNYGIELAEGEFIAFHDSDDIWHEDKLEKQLNVFKNNNVDIVFCKLKKIKDGNVLGYKPEQMKEGFLNPVVNLFGIGTQTLVAKREVFKKFKFDEKLPKYQEFEYLYRVTKEHSIYCLDEALVDYIISSDSISYNHSKTYKASQIIIDKHPEISKKYPIMAQSMSHNLISEANEIKKDNKDEFFSFLKLAFKISNNWKILIKIILSIFNCYYVFFDK